jgi:YD repeat-containing protein
LTELRDAKDQAVISYHYDPIGRLIREDNANGTYTNYTYDALGRPREINNYKKSGEINSFSHYGYDNASQRTSMETKEGRWEYGYDAAGQLISVKTPANELVRYQYDASGNRISVIKSTGQINYTSNFLNQYLTAGDEAFFYDADGNLVRQTGPDGSTIYTFNPENRLTQVASPAGTWVYEYDALGNRSATVFNGHRTEYLVDPFSLGDVLAEYNGVDNSVTRYIHGIGLVGRFNGNANGTFYDFDLGSAAGLTGADGDYVSYEKYLPFGENVGSQGSVANPFGYVGQFGVMKEANGLQFMRARFYSPALGRYQFTAVCIEQPYNAC